jgi:hypothetical protein
MFNECRTIQRSSTWSTPDGQERPDRHWFGRSPSAERVVVHAVDGWPAPTFAGTQNVTSSPQGHGLPDRDPSPLGDSADAGRVTSAQRSGDREVAGHTPEL